MILLVELLVVCALLFEVGFHVGRPGTDEPETVLSIFETIHRALVDAEDEVLGQETPDRERGDKGLGVKEVQ